MPAAGDEIQGVLGDRDSLIRLLRILAEDAGWSVGIGLRAVTITAGDVRESTGDAFVRARKAVERAKKVPWSLVVGGDTPAAARLNQAIAMWYALRDQGLSVTEIGERLEISHQAVSQALQAADHRLDLLGQELVGDLYEAAEQEAR